MIKARSLRVDYDDITAVKDIDLDVAAGEVYGLIGPNGAGKSSAIRALAGVLEPTYGTIELGGVDARRHPERAHAALGYMPDFAPLYDDLTVAEYLWVFATAYGIAPERRNERVQTCLEQVFLTEKARELVKGLSRGMRQRLTLAKTLIPEPRILLLDEPASGLDPIGRAELRDILVNLARNGAAVLISSHILTELNEMCTAVGIMEKGRMVVTGTIESIQARMGARQRLHVRTARPCPELGKLLAADARASEVEVTQDRAAQAQFAGDDAAAAELLAALLAAGAPVASFHLEKEDIEDIFMKIGAREVS